MKVTATMFDNKNRTIKESFDKAEKTKYKQIRPLGQTREDRMAERVIKTFETK